MAQNPGANAADVVAGTADEMVADNYRGLSRDELAADFGSAYGIGLVLATPELMVIAYQSQGYKDAYWDEQQQRVIKGKKYEGVEWDANRVATAVTNTEWYKGLDGNQREADNDRYRDPGSWDRMIADTRNAIIRTATKIGADLTGVDLDGPNGLAFRILRNNYLYIKSMGPGMEFPESIINAFITPYIKPNADGSFAGAAGASAQSVRQLAKDYGVAVTDDWILKTVKGLQDGTMTEVDVRSWMVNNAKSTWSGLAGSISETTSVKDLASSYIQTMANTWEMDPETIDLTTPEIQKALTFIDPNTGQPRQKTVWEFQQELRKDPRWDKTAQGMKELTTAGMAMLKDFGFWK